MGDCTAVVKELVMNGTVVLGDVAFSLLEDEGTPWLSVAELVVACMGTSLSVQALNGLPVQQTSDGSIHYHSGENLLIANDTVL